MTNDKEFLEKLNSLQDGDEIGSIPVTITEKASATGTVQNFNIIIFKKFKGGFKIQWIKGRKPQLPQLTSEVMEILKTQVYNGPEVLTSGYNNASGHNNPGMRTSEDVLNFFKVLEKQGIIINYSV